MKRFEAREIFQAYDHAMDGGQALHVHRYTAPATAPACFRRQRDQEMAHLLDQDIVRLRATARQLGVRIINVEHVGTKRQHVDLCGQPLERAKALCEEEVPK